MKQRIIALTLMLIILLAAVASAFAVEPAANGGDAAAAGETTTQAADSAQTGTTGEKPTEQDAAAEQTPSGETAGETTADAETAKPEEPEQTPAEPAETMLQFKDIEELVKKKNLSYMALEDNISAMSQLEDMVENLRNGIARIQSQIAMLDPATDAAAIAMLEMQQAEMQQALSSVSGMTQDTSQMEAGCKQMILGAQSLFIALAGMEQQETALERQLASLDRTLQEMEVREKHGQVSKLQLMEVQSGRTSLVSGLSTLRMNISNYKMQLEQMVGDEMTGKTPLGPVPAVTEEELNALKLEENLKTAVKNSLDLQAAAAARDKLDHMVATDPLMSGAVADMRNGANHSYDAARQQVELKVRSLYAQLQDSRQIVAAAGTALKCEELSYQAMELKYQQGTISKNALLTAEDELKTAQEALQTAKQELFSTYNNYCWAVKHGVTN